MVSSRWAYGQVKTILQQADVPNAAFDAGQLLLHLSGINQLEEKPLDDATWQQLQALARRRAKREPLQYLLGKWSFLDLELEVGPGVLIPRAETEEVCLAAIEQLQGMRAPCVLDLCAGSGALALGIQSRLPNADITAVELDKEAFVYLVKNCATYAKCMPHVPLPVQADALTYFEECRPQQLDLIVANPPYVTENEYKQLAPELYHEPQQALVAKENGLYFYRVIARVYADKLKHSGKLVFEIGAAQKQAVQQILHSENYAHVKVLQDLAGCPRIAIAEKAAT